MDVKKEIRKENSKTQASKLADYVGNNPSRFKALVEVYLNGPYRVTQRAAWLMGICVEQHPNLIAPHLKKLLDFLSKPNLHDTVKKDSRLPKEKLSESEIFQCIHVMGTVDFVINRLVHEECTMNFVDFHCMHVKYLCTNVDALPESTKYLDEYADDQRAHVKYSGSHVARHRTS